MKLLRVAYHWFANSLFSCKYKIQIIHKYYTMGSVLLDPKPPASSSLIHGHYPLWHDIPADNPFVDTPSARGEIWSIGLRNPWRFNFDVFGNIWIADVGQNNWEEVNASQGTTATPGGKGKSFGWSAFEGNHAFNTDVESPGALSPVFEYEHKDGACSISGGAIGTNTTTSGRAGWYFFGDYCTGTMTAILTDGTSTVASETVLEDLGNITAVRSTFNGMFVISLEGTVRRVISTRQGSSDESP